MKQALVAVVCMCLLGLPAAAQPPAIPDAFLIVPGERLGVVSLNMTAQDITKALLVLASGTQASARPSAVPQVLVWHPASPPGGPIIVRLGADGRAVEIKTYWNTFYGTANGVHIGLSESGARAILGAPRRVHSWSHFRLLSYPGLVLTVDQDSTIVTGIAVISE